VRQSEQNLGFTIISKSRGGKNGGSSVLTPDGKLLANAYRQLQADFNSSVKRVVKEFFQTINR
jgi:molybdate transport repressor ModE-like protein